MNFGWSSSSLVQTQLTSGHLQMSGSFAPSGFTDAGRPSYKGIGVDWSRLINAQLHPWSLVFWSFYWRMPSFYHALLNHGFCFSTYRWIRDQRLKRDALGCDCSWVGGLQGNGTDWVCLKIVDTTTDNFLWEHNSWWSWKFWTARFWDYWTVFLAHQMKYTDLLMFLIWQDI